MAKKINLDQHNVLEGIRGGTISTRASEMLYGRDNGNEIKSTRTRSIPGKSITDKPINELSIDEQSGERRGKINKRIRKANSTDVGRLAEIIVYNNRKNYYPIFKDIMYSFAEYTVANVTEEFKNDAEFMDNCYIYEDTVIKGFVVVVDHEIRKLYVDTFFQNEGIGTDLLSYAVLELNANNLWALEKNRHALRFYERNGFRRTDEKCYEEGTTEFLIHLVR